MNYDLMGITLLFSAALIHLSDRETAEMNGWMGWSWV